MHRSRQRLRDIDRCRQRRVTPEQWPCRDRFVADSYVVDTVPDTGRYTCTLNIPWDWVHRCPPLGHPKAPSVPVVIPYAPPCPAQTVTVPGRYGQERTVSIVRC